MDQPHQVLRQPKARSQLLVLQQQQAQQLQAFQLLEQKQVLQRQSKRSQKE
jgi:hypothetical protein